MVPRPHITWSIKLPQQEVKFMKENSLQTETFTGLDEVIKGGQKKSYEQRSYYNKAKDTNNRRKSRSPEQHGRHVQV